MSELNLLYNELILDRARGRWNVGRLASANREGKGYNPLCGDLLSLWLEVEGGVVKDASFEGSGCAISKASASLMTDAVKGRTTAEVKALFDAFHALVTTGEVPDGSPDLDKLEVFSGVSEFPARVKCASLCWHTLISLLASEGPVTVSTE